MNFDPSHTFITSDHHFGSWKKFIAFKVFSEDEEKTLINKWNSTVCQNDTVIYNGDFHDGDLSDGDAPEQSAPDPDRGERDRRQRGPRPGDCG